MKRTNQKAFVLVAVLFFIVLIIALLGAYLKLSHHELLATKYEKDTVSGFAAAEAGLNLRAEEVRKIFLDYQRPQGVSPRINNPCKKGNNGSGDFVCKSYKFKNTDVMTYIVESPDNPINTTIPQGDRYQNLHASEYRYSIYSVAKGNNNQTQTVLQLNFKSRLVPLFQFAIFYNKDLEIYPGKSMVIDGHIHTNGDLYLNNGEKETLKIYGQVTTAGDLYRGAKQNSDCSPGVSVFDTPMLNSCSSRTKVTNFDDFFGMVESNVEKVTVPNVGMLIANPSATYFADADLRLQLKLDLNNEPDTSYSPTGVVVLNDDGTVDSEQTDEIHECYGTVYTEELRLPIGAKDILYNHREGKYIVTLEIDMKYLLKCLHTTDWLGSEATTVNSTAKGGLVFHFSVDGKDSNKQDNNYGVRIKNAQKLAAQDGPSVKGLTVVTDQAIYIRGDYNKHNERPAAIMADSFNILSEGYKDANISWESRLIDKNYHGVINAAILTGTDSTGNIEGPAGQGGLYNGGIENFPRLHEQWEFRHLTIKGSFVSLDTPKHVNGPWVFGNPHYTAPYRNWIYNTAYNSAENLPPLTPRFVYLKQELFVREY